ncbi:hypothetical protein AB1L42_09560 [Thalassoglobus sp. JC818]|uniref:hypothetical protein n=1 Tax=Thalassoglobus sp. JC818 TaxID=3232136 RepID=UPI003459662B
MSHNTFKTAFWTMLLAFGLTLVLTGFDPADFEFARKKGDPAGQAATEEVVSSDPITDSADVSLEPTSDEIPNRMHVAFQELRPRTRPLARQAQREPAITPLTLSHSSNTSTNAGSEWNESPLQVASSQSVPTANASTHLEAGFQVASADRDARIGQPPVPSSFEQSTPPSFPVSSIPPVTEVVEQKSIMVPIPEMHHDDRSSSAKTSSDDSELSLELSELRRELMEIQLNEARRELNKVGEANKTPEWMTEIRELRQLIEEVRSQAQAMVEVRELKEPSLEFPFEESKEQIVSETIALTIPAEELPSPVVSVSAGSSQERKTFQFENVSIRKVLEIVGQHAGHHVVIEPGVVGDYSGELTDVVPNEAFANLIHAHQLGLRAKGDYVLVRSHPGLK